MPILDSFLSRPKNRKLAIALAFGATILPWPIAGLHKFYLKQPLWGAIYVLLWNTPMPRIASAIDAVWYLVQGEEEFQRRFNNNVLVANPIAPQAVASWADALRELDQLRTEGLLSEHEFEQKRRQLIDRPS